MSCCPICITNYNKSLHKQIICCHCRYYACKTCVRQYLIQTTHDAHCMNCRKKWDLEFLKQNLNANYVTGEYTEHRANILTDRVISQVEEYYNGALLIAESRRLIKEQDSLENDINNLEKQIRVLRGKIENKQYRINAIHDFVYRNVALPVYEQPDAEEEAPDDEHVEKKTRKRFLMPCQNGECRGMLSQAYKCGLCEQFTCSKCFEVKNDDHVCNPDAVASATEIKASSKPCPKCGTRISKIDGCDQMWCVECKTAFSWTRGTIEEGRVHNPHYFQWLGTAEAAAGCNNGIDRRTSRDIINVQEFIEILNKIYNKDNQTELLTDVYISNITQYIAHCEEVHLTPLRNEINYRRNNKHNIYLYFLGELDKNELKTHLLKIDILNQRDIALCDIYDALILMVSQILRDLLAACNPLIELFDQFMKIFEDENPSFYLDDYRTVGHQYPNDALTALISKPFYKKPNQIPECIEIANKIFIEYSSINTKFSNLFKKYTAYINAELIKYILLYGLKRKVSLWNHETQTHKATSFNYKHEYETAEAYWRNIYNNTSEN